MFDRCAISRLEFKFRFPLSVLMVKAMFSLEGKKFETNLSSTSRWFCRLCRLRNEKA